MSVNCQPVVSQFTCELVATVYMVKLSLTQVHQPGTFAGSIHPSPRHPYLLASTFSNYFFFRNMRDMSPIEYILFE